MTYPRSSLPSAPPPAGGGAPDPGFIPLRPMTLGDVLGGAIGVVRRHFTLLVSIAVVIGVVSIGADVAILGGSGTLGMFAGGDWISEWRHDFSTGTTDALPAGLVVSVIVRALISATGTFVLAGVAAACVSVDAVRRRREPGAVAARLRGRWAVLAVASALLAVGVVIGTLVFVIPGILVYVFYALAAPAAVMERSSAATALSRSTRLTRHRRWRILGVTVLVLIITTVIESVISSVVIALAPNLSNVGALIVGDAVTALISGVTISWLAAVIALLYVDARLRGENLAAALRAFAAAHPDRRG